MLRKLITMKTLLLMAAFSSSAAFGASTYDFNLMSTGNEQGFDASGESFSPGTTSASIGGSGLDVTSGNFVYLDGGTMSGLGVCQSDLSGGGNCGSDDNMTGAEWLKFSLTDGTTFQSMTVFGNHSVYGSGTIGIDASGGTTFVPFAVVGGMVDLSGVGSMFSVSAGGEEGYVGALTTVPLPAAAWLFGSAILGLVGIARRRNSARVL